jgi:hypothetical protein
MKYSHPLATIISCNRKRFVIRTRIKIERLESKDIAPASLWCGDPPHETDAISVFSLHRLISRKEMTFEFETYEMHEPQSTLLLQGSIYRFVKWWNPDQLSLAKIDPSKLNKYIFAPNSPEDHDHCYLCWKVICEHDGNDHEAYTNGRDSVCIKCFEKYIISGFGKLLGDAT